MDNRPDSNDLIFSDHDLSSINRRIEHNKQAQKLNKENGQVLMQILIDYRDHNKLRQLESLSISIFEQLIYTFGLTDQQIGEIFQRTPIEIKRFRFKCDLLRDTSSPVNIYTTIIPVVDVQSFADYFRIKI